MNCRSELCAIPAEKAERSWLYLGTRTFEEVSQSLEGFGVHWLYFVNFLLTIL